MKHGTTAKPEVARRFGDFTDMRRFFDALPAWFAPFETMRLEEEVLDDAFVVRAEMPGIDPEKDADIWIADGMLHIKAERRHLTVMFCDIVGSTALSARLDPEDLRDILHAFQRSYGEIIQRFDGHVARSMGDGVLAYFGFPVAHEDDAERAVSAALASSSDKPCPTQAATEKL